MEASTYLHDSAAYIPWKRASAPTGWGPATVLIDEDINPD